MSDHATSPVGWSGTPRRSCSEQVASANSPATLVYKKGSADAVVKKARYVTAAHLAELKSHLLPVEWETIRDVAALNVLSGNQLRRLHYQDNETGRRMARLNLRRLSQHRLISRLGRRVGGERSGSEGFVYALDVAGQRLLRPEDRRPRRPWTPENHHLRHALAVSELYVRLREAEADGVITLEHFDAEPRCWRTFHGLGGARSTLKPDALVVTGNDDYIDSWFVEIDRSTEPTPRIAEKCKLYWRYWQSGREQAEHQVFPTVLFVVPGEHRKAQLVELVSRLPTERWHLFRIVTAETVVKDMSSGMLVDNNPGEEVTS